MIGLIVLLVTLVVAYGGYSSARHFVRDRLRYVDAVQKPVAPLLAGAGAAALAAVLVALIPFVGVGTALGFGIAVGTGVAAGAKDVRRGAYWITDGR
jgi:hypothetical protein